MISCTIVVQKSRGRRVLNVMQFFMKMLRLAFIYKKNDTLHYVTFYIQKARHFTKIRTIWFTFIYIKFGHFALCNFSLKFWNLRRGRGTFYKKNNALSFTFLYLKSNALCVKCFIKKAWHFAFHFYMQEKTHFALRLISKIYAIRKYNQNNQIEK